MTKADDWWFAPGGPADRIRAVADKIEQSGLQKKFNAAWQAVTDMNSMGEVQKAADAFNEMAEPLVREIAEATGNSFTTLQTTMGPQAFGSQPAIWFAGVYSVPVHEHLRQYAKYASFNTDYWAAKELEERQDAIASDDVAGFKALIGQAKFYQLSTIADYQRKKGRSEFAHLATREIEARNKTIRY